MNYNDQLALIEKGKLNGSNSLYVGDPSAMLQAAGFSDAPFAMNQSDYRKSRRPSANNKHYSSHNVSYDFFKEMPNYINTSPMLINNGEKVTIVTSYEMADSKNNNSTVIVGILQNQKMDDKTINQIKSVYPLDDFEKRITVAAEQKKLVITNKNKAKEILTSIGVQPSKQLRILSLAENKITQQQKNVNKKLSLSNDAGKTVPAGDQIRGEDVAVEQRPEWQQKLFQVVEEIRAGKAADATDEQKPITTVKERKECWMVLLYFDKAIRHPLQAVLHRSTSNFLPYKPLLATALYHIPGNKSTACRCISSMGRIVYHQHAVLYIIKPQGYTFGDDIRLTAMIYTLKRDDIPSLRLG